MAEPEADPALIYTTHTLPLTSGVHSPLVYNSAVHSPLVYKTLPVDEKTEKVSTPLVYTHGLPLHQPVVYNTPFQTPLVYNPAVQTPLVYKTPLVNTVYNTALTTPLLSKVFPSLKTITTPVVSHITKREAEADPALLYTTGVQTPIVYNTPVQTPLVYNINTAVQTPLLKTAVHQPIVYNTPVQTPLVYNTAVHTPLLKTVDHAVVPAVGGYIHSSHVGVCTNNLGVRVPC